MKVRVRKRHHQPANGERRWERRFAWTPQAVECGVVWFWHYWQLETYVRTYGDERLFSDGWWKPVVMDAPKCGTKEAPQAESGEKPKGETQDV